MERKVSDIAYQYTFSVQRKILLMFLFILVFFLLYANSIISVFGGFLFLIDWSIYRLGMNERNKKELSIRHQIQNIGLLFQNKKISGKDANRVNGSGRVENKIGAGVALYLIERKKILLRDIVSRLDTSMVLDVGCGITAGHIFANHQKKNYIGTDIELNHLTEIHMEIGVDVVLCDAHHQPFKKEVFQLINLTDVIEHFLDPVLAIQELYELLEYRGRLIISTENRSQFTVECFNPLIFSERALGSYIPRILPPGHLVGQWTGFTPFYHIDFSKKEIVGLMKDAGFKIERYITFNQLSWIIHSAFLLGVNNKNLTKLVSGLENFVMNTPVMKNMGHHMLVCRKV